MKIALIHDHLMQDGGAEKVLQEFQTVWPDAPTYTLLYDKERVSSVFAKKDIRTSFLQNWPLAMKRYQWYLPLMPLATESYDLDNFDVVLSSSSAFSKGVVTTEHTTHICYCHTPTRYLWSDTHSYVKELTLPWIIKTAIRPILSRLRLWDRLAADRVDVFVANSKAVQKRIRKYYKRDSLVIHPPVDLSEFYISNEPKEYFLAGGRIVGYKRFDIVVEAFIRTGLPLKIFGTGPLLDELKAKATDNIEFLGKISDKEKTELYAKCKAYLHPQEEDFGITPVEAMASGRPVIAYAKGGALETVIEGKTGTFLEEQTWEELGDKLMRFDESVYNPEEIREHARQFDISVFRAKMKELISKYENRS